MTFDEYAASRPKPTWPDDTPWGAVRTTFANIKLYDDRAADALRSRNAYQRRMLILVERNAERRQDAAGG